MGNGQKLKTIVGHLGIREKTLSKYLHIIKRFNNG